MENQINAYFEYDNNVFRNKTILLPCDDPEWSNFTKYFAANFKRFGIKKLISTSYAKGAGNKQITMFEMDSPLFDAEKHKTHGKLFTLTRNEANEDNPKEIEFSGYLEGDGDFRSEEVTALRDESDIIITNEPFSLFRPFLAWIMEANKKFVIIGNQNAITYKEVFPLLKENKIWLGESFPQGNAYFSVPSEFNDQYSDGVFDKENNRVKFRNCCWFTNIDHGKRHQPMILDTMEHNLKHNKKLRKKLHDKYGVETYPKYDNYDAIEVPYVECIPSDYLCS